MLYIRVMLCLNLLSREIVCRMLNMAPGVLAGLKGFIVSSQLALHSIILYSHCYGIATW